VKPACPDNLMNRKSEITETDSEIINNDVKELLRAAEGQGYRCWRLYTQYEKGSQETQNQ